MRLNFIFYKKNNHPHLNNIMLNRLFDQTFTDVFRNFCCSLIKLKNILTFCILILVIFLSTSCLKDDYQKPLAGHQWSPNIALPVVHSKMSLWQILNDYDSTDLFVEDGSNFLFLVYAGTVFSQRADELIKIPNQTINKSLNFSIPAIVPAGDSISIPLSNIIEFNSPTGNERFDEMHVKSGIMPITFTSNINHKARINITIPSITKNGVPLKSSLYYNYSGTPITVSTQVDLTGYKITFFSSGAIKNRLTINYSITVYGDGIPSPASNSIDVGVGFSNILFSKLYGYLGQPGFVIKEDTIDFNMFLNNLSGRFNFVDPKLNLFVTNSYGLPINITFQKFSTQSYHNAPYNVNVSGAGLPNPWVITGAPSMGSSSLSSIHLNKTNSNIDDAVNVSPQHAMYDVIGLANPSGNADSHNFVADTSRFKVDVEFNLPLWGTGKDFIIQDTLDMNYMNIKEVEYARINVKATNGFPLESKLQIYFVDSLYHRVDSLFNADELIIQPATVGNPPQLLVEHPTEVLTEKMVDNTRWSKLKDCKQVLFKATVSSLNHGDPNYIVKIYSQYYLDVKVGIQVQLKVNSSEY